VSCFNDVVVSMFAICYLNTQLCSYMSEKADASDTSMISSPYAQRFLPQSVHRYVVVMLAGHAAN
jgi:hypothetical protein